MISPAKRIKHAFCNAAGAVWFAGVTAKLAYLEQGIDLYQYLGDFGRPFRFYGTSFAGAIALPYLLEHDLPMLKKVMPRLTKKFAAMVKGVEPEALSITSMTGLVGTEILQAHMRGQGYDWADTLLYTLATSLYYALSKLEQRQRPKGP